MPNPYEQALNSANLRVSKAKAGLSDPGVTDVLNETSKPGTFEQAFRFLGRPGFATRDLLSGDPVGALKNVGQFLNEAFFMGLGALNSDWTLTHALSYIPGLGDLPSDITTREDRPEASDLLHRWGVLDPKDLGPFEKMGVDIIGGARNRPTDLGRGRGQVRGRVCDHGRGSDQPPARAADHVCRPVLGRRGGDPGRSQGRDQ
jgi:hypothetical protein